MDAKEIKLVARPWQPQDLLDDLQLIIDEECDNYLNTRRTTLCMARDYLKEYFATDNNVGGKVTPTDKDINVPSWIPVTERLPEEEDADEHDCVLVHTSNRDNLIVAREAVRKCTEFMTHWQPLHEPTKEVDNG